MVGVVGGASGSGDSLVTVCIELATGNLQRNLTLIAETIDSPTATGRSIYGYRLCIDQLVCMMS